MPILRSLYHFWRFCEELPLRLAFYIYYTLAYLFVEMPRRRRGRDYRLHHSGALNRTGLWCILAAAQYGQVSNNLLAYLACLKRAGYNIILVNNGPMPEHLTTRYLDLCHTVVERAYGGRDFGSYQCATRLLRAIDHQGEPIRQVIYCNDSNFVRPSSLELLLDRLVQRQDDYLCIMEVFQFHYHVQSWFFAISGRVFESPAFARFWQTYVPLSYRRHAINKGEVGIAKHLMRNGVYPQPLYSQSTIVNLIFGEDVEETLGRLAELTSPDDFKTFADRMKLSIADDSVSLALLKRNMMERIAETNTMHTTNLLLLKAAAFPFLKKDLVYRAQYFFTQVEDCVADWTGEDAAHVPEILAHFRSRDSLRWQRSPAAALARRGLI